MTQAQSIFIPRAPRSEGALHNMLFVDGATPVPDVYQNGSILAPYSAIQKAIDVIPEATTAAEARNVWCVIIAPGDYDEDLAVVITGRRILLLSWGPWGLGVFNAADWAPSGVRRNITISGNGAPIDGVRPGFGIAPFPGIGERASTHQAYFTGARISGQILVTATGGSIEVDVEAEVFGTDGTSAGVSFDATTNNPILQTYLYNGRWRGRFLGGTNCQLQHADRVRFDGLVDVGGYSLIDNCRINDGFKTIAAPSATLEPDGFVNTIFTGGTFDGPANSLRLDSFTDYWVQTNNIALVSGATKVFYDPQGRTFVRNESGGALLKGQVVYIAGFDNPTNLPLVELARADAEITARAVGIVENDIADNSNGWVMWNGTLLGLNTAAFTDGDSLWLSETVAGAYQDTVPESPNYVLFLGYVLDAAGGTNGSLLVTLGHPARLVGEVYHFGADMVDAGNQGDYFAAHGTAGAAAVASLNSDSEVVMPNGGIADTLSWNSVSANPGPPPASRTVFKVLQNGLVVETISVTGVSGFADLPNKTVFTTGDKLAIEYDSGDAPGRTILELEFR